MKAPSGQMSIPEWQYFLTLGEQLLKQPDPAKQCEIIRASVESRICCWEVHVWLAPQYYPLPGSSSDLNLFHPSNSPLVQAAIKNQQTLLQSGDIIPADEWNGSTPALAAAAPIITQNFLLGIIEVQNSSDAPLSHDNLSYLERLAANAALALQVTRQVALKNWRYEQLALVRSVGDQIANVMDLDLLCQRVTELICNTFQFYFVSIFTTEEDS